MSKSIGIILRWALLKRGPLKIDANYMCTSILSLTVFDSTEYHILLSVHLLASLRVEYLQVVSNSHMLTILNVIHVR